MVRTLLVSIIFILFPTPAFAYIDAGIGALLFQSLIAGFFTFMVMWRSWVDKVKSFFGYSSPKNESEGGITKHNEE